MKTYAWFVRGERHAAMAQTSIASVRKAENGGVRCVVVTDEVSPSWNLFTKAQIVKIPSGMPIMLANLQAQIDVLMGMPNSEQFVFLDTDIILQRPIPSLGDLTITWRDHVGVRDDEKIEGVAGQMPYNYGVIAARKTEAAIESFIFMRERIRRMHSQHREWYGNQLALVELAGQPPKEGLKIDRRTIPWMLTSHGREVDIAKIPCDTWNYTPESITEDVSNRGALHFKGHSRHLMEGFAKKLDLPWVTLTQEAS